MGKSELMSHALCELAIAYKAEGDVLEGVAIHNVLHGVQVFSEEGHSGGSAPYGIEKIVAVLEGVTDKRNGDVLRTLLSFEPLTPLTGHGTEWFVHGHPDCYAQNVRCSHVFQRPDGTAYDIQGRVFEDPDGTRWTTADSHVDVTFPYTPKTEIVKRQPETAEG